MQSRYVEYFIGPMRDECRNEVLFLNMGHARVEIATWVANYDLDRPHSSLGYETPAAFAAKIDEQWPVRYVVGVYATQTIASTALMRDKASRPQSQLGGSWGPPRL
jgi:putative transposase